MKISELTARYECRLHGETDTDISGISYDSRAIKSGWMFVAAKGVKADGHDYIEKAIACGASAIVCEQGNPVAAALMPIHTNVAWVEVSDCRDALAAFSSAYYGYPSEKLCMVGITGTNGKTSVSYLIKNIFDRCSRGAGLIGTIRYMIKDESFDAPHTTPEASDLQALLGSMVVAGCDYAIAEVSSHALAQKRADHTAFRVAVFTNLTGDHLDYHRTMEDYFMAKTRLFTELLVEGGSAVINVDDEYGMRLSEIIRTKRPDVRIAAFSAREVLADSNGLYAPADLRITARGTRFSLHIPGAKKGLEISSQLVGETAVYNILAAAAAAVAAGVNPKDVAEGIAVLEQVKGRFERVDCGQKFLAVVDYAHTHDALERLLKTARKLLRPGAGGQASAGKIITVFGCGGNRDRGKRPLMGNIATELSDFAIVTSDNPRDEAPENIIRDIETGIKCHDYVVIPDRAIAIKMAVLLASPGDIVIVAGKGHEDYQEIAGVRHPFSDRAVIEESISEAAAISARVRSRKEILGEAQC